MEEVYFEIVERNVERIKSAITTGAQWEVWFQTEIAVNIVEAGGQAAREVYYPDKRRTLDILCRPRGEDSVAIELKAESAHHAGQAAGKPIRRAMETDWQKVKDFVDTDLHAVASLAWSPQGKRAVQSLADDRPDAVALRDIDGLSAIMINADLPL